MHAIRRADYSWQMRDGVVCIVGRCTAGYRSVTNDAENVLREIAASGVDLRVHRVIYRDSAGVWDELVINGFGMFCGFDSLGEVDLEAALAKLKGGNG